MPSRRGERATLSIPKLTPPRRRSDTVRRARLHRLLSDALEHDVIVVSAPAGYGKSTLAVDWLAELGLPSAWLSLDRQDRDPVSLIQDLTSAVRTINQSVLSSFAAALTRVGESPDVDSLLAEFVAAVQTEMDDLFVLVVDDLNALEEAPDAISVIDTLAQSMPLSARLVVLTRSWMMLPSLPRLSAQRRAFSLTVRDLQFTDDEAVDLLRAQGASDDAYDEPSFVSVIRRADGWAAALAILGEHFDRSRPADASAAEFILADFIDDEVLSRLEQDQLTLLESCAVLQSFDVPLVRELSGYRDAAKRLRELERATHLIVRLEDGEWYRIHGILREHLISRIYRDDPERLRKLRRSAAALYARRGMRRDAVEMTLDAQDWSEAVPEILELREELYQHGEWSTLVGWLDRLPADILNSEPELALARARHALKAGEGHRGLAQLDAVDDACLLPEQLLRREIYRSVGLRHLGRLSEAIEVCRSARAIAREQIDDPGLTAELDLEEGMALGVSGYFARGKERFESSARAFEALHDQHRAAEAHDGLGNCLAYLGQLGDAMRAFTKAQRLWRVVGDVRQQIATMSNIGDVQRAMGELETARDTFNAVIQRSRDLRFPRGEAYGQENLAAVEHDLGELVTASSLRSFVLHAAQDIDDPALVNAATLGLALVYREQGEFNRARALLEHGLRNAEQGGMLLSQSQFRSALGAVLLGESRYEEAFEILVHALREATDSGERREQAIAHFRMAAVHLGRRQRTSATAELAQVARLAREIGYDEFLFVEARQLSEVVEFAVARRVGGDFFRSLRDHVPPVRSNGDEAETASQAPTQIRAEAFGSPRVLMGGRPLSDLEWRSERSKEMFFFLLQSGRPLRKEQIAVELWPDVAQEQINSAFHSTLYRLRKAIDKQVVIQTDDGYQVSNAFDISYDAREFEEHMGAAERAKPGGKRWFEEILAAVRLYRGPFAETFDSEWADHARRQYEDRYVASLVTLAAQALRRSEYSEVIVLTDSIMSIDPLNDDAVRYQMLAHARAGHPELATRTYRRYHDALRDELGVEPPSSVRAEYERVISGAALDAS